MSNQNINIMNKQELLNYFPSISVIKNLDLFCDDAEKFPLYSQEHEEDPIIIGLLDVDNGKNGEEKRGASFLLTEIQPLHDNGVSAGACEEFPEQPNIVCFGYSMTADGPNLGYIHLDEIVKLANVDAWNVKYFHIGTKKSKFL